MLRVLKAFIFIVVALVVVFLSIANRQPVTVSLDPFSQTAPELFFSAPLFLVLFAAVAVGVVIGGAAAWMAQHRKRKALRQARREADNLKTEAASLRAEAERLRAEAAARQPSLPAPGVAP